jgi:hypothetical protein
MPRAAHTKSKRDGEWASAVGELANKFGGTRAPGSFFGASGRRRQRDSISRVRHPELFTQAVILQAIKRIEGIVPILVSILAILWTTMVLTIVQSNLVADDS